MRATFVRWIVRFLDRVMPKRLINRAALPDHLRVGWRGEEDAYFYLRKLGYMIVAKNWRTQGRKGEIDLIGWDGDMLCFIEVKTRTTRDVKPAEAAVDWAKQRELSGMARQYLRHVSRRRGVAHSTECGPERTDERGSWPAYRFDVVSVYYDNQSRSATDITLFRNAFSLS